MKNKAICIGVPTYNGESTIAKTLQSLENQKFDNFSVIISDDNSTDKTLEIVKYFCDKNDNFSFTVNKNNLGMFANCNKLILNSKSKYFGWVPQDDLREKDFLKECFIGMENNEKSVLSFAHTGVRYKKNGELMHVNTIKSLSSTNDYYKRYVNLTKNFHDSIVYGLIRSEALKKTSLWKNINGSANRLIFELCLLGEFVEIKKVLSYYYGMGLKNRYDSSSEYLRSVRKKKNFFQIPFVTLFYHQIIDILKSDVSFFKRLKILIFLIFYFLKVNSAKFMYRFISKIFLKKFDDNTYNFIQKIIPENKDINYIVDKNKYLDFYPEHYPYKKIDGIKSL